MNDLVVNQVVEIPLIQRNNAGREQEAQESEPLAVGIAALEHRELDDGELALRRKPF